MSAHTPARWSIEYDHATNAPKLIRAFINNEMYDIASVLCDETESAAANARLIAAAPDLLEALKATLRCLKWHEQRHGVGMDAKAVKDAFAAIAKATGENA